MLLLALALFLCLNLVYPCCGLQGNFPQYLEWLAQRVGRFGQSLCAIDPFHRLHKGRRFLFETELGIQISDQTPYLTFDRSMVLRSLRASAYATVYY